MSEFRNTSIIDTNQPSANVSAQNELFNNIVQIVDNRKNLKYLLDNYNNLKLVSFIGAGASTSLGIPDWDILMKDMIKEFVNDKEIKFDCKYLIENKEWIDLAQKIYDFLKNDNKQKLFEKFLVEKMNPTKNTTTLSLIKMILVINEHITTNFDNSIDYAYKFMNFLNKNYYNKEEYDFNTHYIPDLDYNRPTNDINIFYIHGNAKKRIFVIKKEDYEIFYPSDSLKPKEVSNTVIEDCLKYFYKKYNILFIGFKFSDKYLKKYFFRTLPQIIKNENEANKRFLQGQDIPERIYKHFWLISENNQLKSVKGANLKGKNLTNADMIEAFLVKADFR